MGLLDSLSGSQESFKNRAACLAGKGALDGDRGRRRALDDITVVNPTQPLGRQ